VIVDTNDHQKQLQDLTDFEIKDLLKVYKQRIEALSAKQNIRYVLVFKNHGRDAGTSLKHSHTQVTATNHIPGFVTQKLEAVHKHENCPYCEIISIEKTSTRRCFENDSFVAFTPYASRYNYEIWIFPKKHYASITQIDDWEYLELAQIFKKALQKLKDLGCSYNFFIHNTPQQLIEKPKSLHFHLEICPRMSTFGGFEMGSEIIINTVSPELAAKFFRGE
jgi:UDPglucose--hexose-1-phosphate uridylyltransferase